MRKTQAKITVIILLFQTVTILFLVVSMVLLLGNALDQTFESQDIMLCESAKVSGNSEYLKKCACYYQSEKISCVREIK